MNVQHGTLVQCSETWALWNETQNFFFEKAQNMCLYSSTWNKLSHVKWKPVYAICEQQRRRSACASAQSDQRLCFSLPRKYNISSFYIRNLKPLASLCGWAGQWVLPGRKPRRQVFSWRGSIGEKKEMSQSMWKVHSSHWRTSRTEHLRSRRRTFVVRSHNIENKRMHQTKNRRSSPTGYLCMRVGRTTNRIIPF